MKERPRVRARARARARGGCLYVHRERIDLKLGVAAVTAGRKPLLQFAPICASEILDRVIVRRERS